MEMGQQTIDIAVVLKQGGMVIFGDMDGLKYINDNFGHDAGDRAIKAEAEILKKNGSNVTECPMFELQNGCICCTLREEFIKQIEKISNLDTVDLVFVEASGISDPGAVSASFRSVFGV